MRHDTYLKRKLKCGALGISLFPATRHFVCLICSLLLALPLWSQASGPGGVLQPSLWFSSTGGVDGKTYWKNRLNGQVIDQQVERTDRYLNFNSAFSFDRDQQGLELPTASLNLQKWTLFTVYHPRDTFTEKSIWSYTLDEETIGILTTRRMADLKQFEYLNFSGRNHQFPQINTYLHYQSKKQVGASQKTRLLLAQKPSDHELPISSFTGEIPEVILYERVLAPEERRRVETYLAIKYGTNLAPDQAFDYLDASGRTLFAPAQSGDFTHRITGIGRDELSGLYQKQSTSSYAPGLLTIGLGEITQNNSTNTYQLPDRHFLLWADNNQPLEWADRQSLQPLSLRRNWLVQASEPWDQVLTEVQFDVHQLRSPAPAGETYWLRIDRSGLQNASTFGPFDYYPLQQIDASGKAHFRDVHWDTDGSGQDIFTLLTGPELLVDAQMELPQCFPEQSGRLRLKAIGGRAPFTWQVSREGRLMEQWTVLPDGFLELNDLPPGHYNLLLRDAAGREYRENFFFQSTDAPLIKLNSTYQLPKDQVLKLDARPDSPGSTIRYEWQSPDGVISKRPVMEVTQSGTYTLRVDQAGCTAQQTILIEPAPQGNFRRLSLFPNPSSDGHFQARIHLEKVAELEVSIFQADGRLLLKRQLSGSDYYHTGEQLTGKGTYLVRFRSQNDQFTIPFVVQ